MFEHNRLPLSVLVSLGLVGAAFATQLRPTVDYKKSPVSQANTLTLPPPTETYTPFPSLTPTRTPNMLAITPGWRQTVVNEISNAAATKGVDGLIEEGLPVELIESQKTIKSVWQYDVTIDNKTTTYLTTSRCTSTAVKSPDLDGYFYITAEHCISAAFTTYLKASILKEKYPNSLVAVNNMQLVAFGASIKEFREIPFGVAHFIDFNFPIVGSVDGEGSIYDGVGIIFISKEDLTEEENKKIEQDALSVDQIMFGKASENAEFAYYCMPGSTSYLPVPMQGGTEFNATETVNQGYLIVEPAITDRGCSGGGIIVNSDDGKSYLDAVIIGSWKKDPVNYDKVSGYKLSAIGKNQLLDLVSKAKEGRSKLGGRSRHGK